VVIRLFEEDGTVVLEVEDAGQGMPEPDAHDAPVPLGVGLAGMRERMRQLGGALTVRSGANGTCVRAAIVSVHTAEVSVL
jgi:signal transduction histidine kinase